ncbi:TetR/AcrR family transcriptional regulator [Mesorhizobium escarrei]|uniref:HTH tetR-type domain-containing protein n=1 Tax=Mesorhizobium escarrei TaxID=666018 RepID=A0ABM9E796_9HYPH|nr:TetR/AcrR family transcriptional regulator [Mesorhizobium escarrei]CAH2404613.1 hypothetical protein MES5069_430027 [Mesorhizobium escarrei]
MIKKAGQAKARLGRPRTADPQLTRQRILEAALATVEREGLERLSMRRLATELGVDPMSIYHHIPDKQRIIAGVVELVFAGMQRRCERNAPWVERVLDWAHGYHDLTRSHPYIVLPIVKDPDAVAIAMLAVSEPLYEAFQDAGLTDKSIATAADTLVDFLNGFALGEPSSSCHEPNPVVSHRLAEQAPTLARVLRLARTSGSDSWDRVKLGVEIIIAGVCTTLATRNSAD